MKNKLIKKGVGFFLALFLFVLAPFSAFGYGQLTADATAYLIVNSGSDVISRSDVYGTDKPVYITSTKYKQSELDAVTINMQFKVDVTKHDKLSLDFVIPLGRFLKFDFTASAFTATATGQQSKQIFRTTGSINGDTDVNNGAEQYYYSYASDNDSFNTFHYENECKFSYTGTVYFSFVMSNFNFGSASNMSLAFALSDLYVSLIDPETSLLSGITDFLRSIWEAITGLPNAIGNMFSSLTGQLSSWFDDIGKSFTELGNSISGFFTNLINNIKTQFTNITNNLKTWFDNIGKWFSELWDNISSIFNEAIDGISEWWNGLVEWFKNLWVIPDGYMEDYKNKFLKWFEEHFGFLFQSIQLIFQFISLLSDIFTHTPDGTITIPEITLPWGNHVILHQTTFSFDDMINSHSQFKWIFGLIRTVSSAIVIVTFVNYSYNKMNEFIKNRKENEG